MVVISSRKQYLREKNAVSSEYSNLLEKLKLLTIFSVYLLHAYILITYNSYQSYIKIISIETTISTMIFYGIRFANRTKQVKSSIVNE